MIYHYISYIIDIQPPKYYAKKKRKKIIKHCFLDNLTGVMQRNKLKSTISWVALWRILVAVKSGINAVLLLPAVFRFLVFTSHTALCQLWLCNMHINIIDFSFWLMLWLQSLFMHLFFTSGTSKLYIIWFLALYQCTCGCSLTRSSMFCYFVIS